LIDGLVGRRINLKLIVCENKTWKCLLCRNARDALSCLTKLDCEENDGYYLSHIDSTKANIYLCSDDAARESE